MRVFVIDFVVVVVVIVFAVVVVEAVVMGVVTWLVQHVLGVGELAVATQRRQRLDSHVVVVVAGRVKGDGYG